MQRRELMQAAVAGLAASGARAAAPVTVLELFTSQGCSSCPPAEALLGELSHKPGVIALAWHVDYWNSAAWHDPYANRTWTARQHAYASRLQTELYTPALVVNGAAMIVGSDRGAVQGAMQSAPRLVVAIGVERRGSAVLARVSDLPAGASLLRVAYVPEAVTGVRGGENWGRRLQEHRIVQNAMPVPMPDRVAQDQTIAVDAVPPGMGVVLLASDEAGRLIAAADLPPA